MKTEYYSPKLWELVEQGEIPKKTALYRWLNKDAGQIIVDGPVFWIEYWSDYPTDKAFKEIKEAMKKYFNKEYYIDRIERGRK